MQTHNDEPQGEDFGPSNLGRWGEEDQRGTLNLIDPEHIRAAASLVRRGVVIPLGAPVGRLGPIDPDRDRTWHTVKYTLGPLVGEADDIITLNSHAGTHIDALGHSILHNRMYNGYPVAEHMTSSALTRNAISNVGAIVGRGVLLDMARHMGVDHLEMGQAILPSQLDECARDQGVTLGRGDICLVRTGWYSIFETERERFDAGEPGISYLAAQWFYDLGLVAFGSDNCAVDVVPGESGVEQYGLHWRVVNQQGGYLMEYLDLEELARQAAYEFLFVAAPLLISGGAGSPLNPVAIL